ncbi:MAG TPA: FAD-dependent oxidoreductase [Chloroflexota bacterium]|nr:FAD-dependent oxidoreductase [Chloroflexota bacterium]
MSPLNVDVAIVGTGAVGDATAMGLRRFGFDGSIVLLGAEAEPPYDRTYLSKQFLRGDASQEKLMLRPPGEYERQRIELRLGAGVTGGAQTRRELELDDGTTIRYRNLVLGTGASPRLLPGIPQAENIRTLRSMADGIGLREALSQSNRLLLVGMGFIGAEVAASARELGKEVLAIEAARVPLERALGEEMGTFYAQIHRDHGVDLRLGVQVRGWTVESGRLRAVELDDGTVEDVDLALIAVGVAPNVEPAIRLGIEARPAGVSVDESLRVMDGVHAGGDIALHAHPVFGRQIRVEHWQVAQKHGTAIAKSIVEGDADYDELPWFWSDQYDLNLQYVGHAGAFDDTARRDQPDGGGFSVFYLQRGVVQAVLSVNDGRTGRLSRPLIRDRRSVATDVLSDPNTDLRALAQPAAAT